jgi:hypothetical protein
MVPLHEDKKANVFSVVFWIKTMKDVKIKRGFYQKVHIHPVDNY